MIGRKPSPPQVVVDPYALPTTADWELACNEEVLDAEGVPHRFGDLIAGDEKVLVIFIRHFWCGLCQTYITHLSTSLPTPSPLRTIIIGCGSPSPIPTYQSLTSSSHLPTYANPSLALYNLLGFGSTLDMGPGRREEGQKVYAGAAGSTWDMIRGSLRNAKLKDAGKTGPLSQNGGELIISSSLPTYIHRMQNTADHLDLSHLFPLLGLPVSSIYSAPPRKGSKDVGEGRRGSSSSSESSGEGKREEKGERKSEEKRRGSWFGLGLGGAGRRRSAEKGCGCGEGPAVVTVS